MVRKKCCRDLTAKSVAVITTLLGRGAMKAR
jgi:hypothetical protein